MAFQIYSKDSSRARAMSKRLTEAAFSRKLDLKMS